MFESAVTRGIQIEVESRFLPEHSDLESRQYFFSYRIRIKNDGGETVQLLSRHWIITDGFGRIEEVKGPGVVGKQPHLRPGESFEYESFCPLTTPTGTMQGTYQMVSHDGSRFEVVIPQFFLVEPNSFH